MTTTQELTGHAPNWCPGCVLPGTLIHKNPSVEKIEDIKEGDCVLGSDGSYHKVTEVFVHRHRGKMYRIRSMCLGKTTLTEEHPVLAVERKQVKLHNTEFELKWTRADKLKKGDYVAFPILKEEKDLREIKLPLKRKKMDRKSKPLPQKIKVGGSFLRLCGYYIAEGHVHKREIVLTFNTKEMGLVDEVKRLAKEIFGLNATSKIREHKHTIDVTIHSSMLSRVFKEWFGTGAANKKIPHFIMTLPKEKQKELIRAMWLGDGWVGKGIATYKTISHVLIEQLKLLLIRQQVVPVLSIESAHGMHKEAYTLHIVNRRDIAVLSYLLGMPIKMRPKCRAPSSIILEEFVLTPISDIKTFDYDGPVHNFEVEGVHSYVCENATLHNCGNFSILLSLKGAIAKLGIPAQEVVVASGIGCSGKLPHFIKTYGFESIHGRAMPAATGIHLANNKLTTIIVGGDGDGYGIGMGHFIHAMRRNLDMCYIVHDNEIYGLTTGQTSPTTKKGIKTKSTPNGSIEKEVNPLMISLAAGATFVARGFSGDIPHLTGLIAQGIKHRGISHIDVLQPCVTWRKDLPYSLYQQKVYKLEAESHDSSSFESAMKKAQEKERWPIGIFYKTDKPIYTDEIPFIKEKPLTKHDMSNIDITKFVEEFF